MRNFVQSIRSDLIDVCDVLSVVIIPKFRTEDKRFCAGSDHRHVALSISLYTVLILLL